MANFYHFTAQAISQKYYTIKVRLDYLPTFEQLIEIIQNIVVYYGSTVSKLLPATVKKCFVIFNTVNQLFTNFVGVFTPIFCKK